MRREDIEQQALVLFDFLKREHLFSAPEVTRSPLTTTIVYKESAIAIEIGIDWREEDAAVALVRLENGRLPRGYYVSNGIRCREYLVTWLAARNRYSRQSMPRRRSVMAQLERAKNLLAANIGLIKKEGPAAFGPATSSR